MKEYLSKIKSGLIKFRDHVYDDYGITHEGMNKFLRIIAIIIQVILGIILFPTTIIGYAGSLFVLSLVYPFFAIIYLLFSILLLFYALFRDKLDERLQIL